MTYPETTCLVLGCDRAVMRSSTVYNRCPDHVRALLRAFGPDIPDRPDFLSGARAVDGFPPAASGSRVRQAARSVVSPV